MKILETERLFLRTFQEEDVESLIAINEDPKVMQFFPSIPTREETIAFIDRIISHQEEKNFSLYAAEIKKTGEMIGFVGLFTATFEAHFTPAIEIGWRISSKHWNQGYATEAAKAVLDYAFKTLGLDEIVSFTSTLNKPSIRVMRKIGLHTNSEDDFDNPKVPSGSPLVGHVLYRLKRSEYFLLQY
ncbi:TPA: GNAT family N-acetyltransferase [Legionella pneumophila]|uniref:N-acetyltransferase domain-containing protein n=1 Tax=Legionella pneumophila subsp. pneumophila TaxID=91891 RepID=A0AAV2V0B3_LEGPN|nr:GNAT family N-acetyltransferase [Legionella pneumophila]AMQ28639.1 GNAT family acetyltransferase [Legionella pneumophila subsp. pneumophila]ANN93339.1 GNAT family acetyltransferase [Legionella pneumophila]MCH9091238.1 GNAT family N-acetyltransferase [Legionella pneumophila serogroup 1]MCH9132784.1 GNAT family N-acetyltransferase [Legionella pneumophila serogroup 1]MCZ4680353.1 GNAT family N-acetyltransferase [Legionella pneumophila]